MKMRKTVLAAALLMLIAVPAAFAGDDKNDKFVEVQILGFNDFHGNVEPPTGSGGEIRTSNSPITAVPAGGSEYMATHLKALEAANPNTVIVSAGDAIGASPLLSGLFHDEPAIESLNLMGVDIAGVGNHEFDEGRQELLRMQYGGTAHEGGGANTGSAYVPFSADGCHPVDGCQDGTPFYGSVFQYLAANVIDQSTKNPLLPSYEIHNVAGSKIAFIGETLEGTPEIVTPAGVQGLTFLDEADTVNMLVPRLKQIGVEAIVVVIHEGGFQSGPTWLYNTCEGFGGPLTDIVTRMDDEVDVVISGHTHQPYLCTIDGKLVTSASSFGRIITDIDLTIDRRTDDIVAKTMRNVIVTRDVAKAPEQTALIARYNVIAGPIRDRVVGTATADLTRVENAAGETSLGDVIADAQLAATSPTDFGGAVAAFMNPGGIRADILAGDVTYGEVFTTQPFANTMVVKTCTGTQIDAVLEQQWALQADGSERQRILQVSDGFTYAYDKTLPRGSRIDIASIKIDGVAVGATTNYRVAANNFVMGGGDGFTTFNSCTNQLGGEVDSDALAKYFVANTPPGVSPGPQNRITRLG